MSWQLFVYSRTGSSSADLLREGISRQNISEKQSNSEVEQSSLMYSLCPMQMSEILTTYGNQALDLDSNRKDVY